MLILSRKVGQEIVIGSNIRVTVVAIRGKQVQLGVTAPAGIPIWRQERPCHADEPRGSNIDGAVKIRPALVRQETE
jgi:carbon storage regulator CsrA